MAKEKVNNSMLSLPTSFQNIGKIYKEQGFYPLKDKKSILFPYSRDLNHYGVWWVENMFSKHAGSFSKKLEANSICPILKTLFYLRSKKIQMTMMRVNHFIHIPFSRTTGALQYKY